MQPPTIPINGPQRRNVADPRSMSAATITVVASAVRGASSGFTFDASSSRLKTTEARVIERIIIIVPPTIGVTMRLRRNSHLEMTIWIIAVTITRVISVAGPPSTTAVMQNGMAKAAVNIGRTAPAPTGPILRTCISVDKPTTTREAKTIQVT